MTAGPKRAYFDRVEWTIMPDGGTAMAALQKGEIDWWERSLPDGLARLSVHPDIKVEVRETIGLIGALRFNALHPPFDNPAVRRIVLSAFNQADFMTAVVGTDHALWRDRVGVYAPGTAMANDAGLDVLSVRTDFDALRRDLSAAGYNGEKMVLLASTDTPAENDMNLVAADLFQKIGLNVSVSSSDWGTLVQRCTNRGPVAEGGWSCFITGASGDAFINPATSFFTRGNGLDGWFGWPTGARLEAPTQQWIDAEGLAPRQAICRDIQQQVWLDLPYAPLGQFLLPTAHRRSITGLCEGFAHFYDVRPA
jgi:peptide/nickel transport system substrate-binding protein